MTAQTFEEFETSCARSYGQAWADENCASYMRGIGRQLREMAARPDVSPEDAHALRWRADRMDPDLRPPREEVSDAAAHS